MGKGQLLFKGDKAKKKKKKKSKHSTEKEAIVDVPSSRPTTTKRPIRETEPAPSAAIPTVRNGTGTITTSGTVVTGSDTRFEKEIANGDAILCVVNGQEELRVVTMRLSNQSLNLSSAFSSNLKQPTQFQYIRKPKDAAQERKERQKLIAETEKEQQTHAFDLYKGGHQVVYREKTETGSYRIKREDLKSTGTSRGDLLALRSKKTSDKYC